MGLISSVLSYYWGTSDVERVKKINEKTNGEKNKEKTNGEKNKEKTNGEKKKTSKEEKKKTNKENRIDNELRSRLSEKINRRLDRKFRVDYESHYDKSHHDKIFPSRGVFEERDPRLNERIRGTLGDRIGDSREVGRLRSRESNRDIRRPYKAPSRVDRSSQLTAGKPMTLTNK